MVTMRPSEARDLWKALVDNSSSLIADAYVLLGVDSVGRARSLTVLAQKEVGKGPLTCAEFGTAWSMGDEMTREVSRLTVHGRSHVKKYLEALDAARQANLDKQAGFYVDRSDAGEISSPTTTGRGNSESELQTAAQVVEMLLIQDHSRMKMYARNRTTTALTSSSPAPAHLPPRRLGYGV